MDKTDHDLLVEIHTMMMGANGQGGCYRRESKLAEDYFKFKRMAIGVFLFLLGSGAITLGALEIPKLMMR